MARPSKYNWKDIKKHYEIGMSQKDIILEFGCPKSSLSERVKKENWVVNELANSYIKGSIEVNEQKANLTEQDVRIVEIADKAIMEETRRRGLIFNMTELNLEKLNNHLKEDKKLEKINVGDGVQKFEEVALGTSDYKNAQDTIDKASITLGVNQRHANSQINVNTQNNMQQNQIGTIDDIYGTNV